MKKRTKKIYLQQKKRYLKKLFGTNLRPRLSVFRSHQHIYAQLIDDTHGNTLAFASTLDKSIATRVSSTKTVEASFFVGELLADKAREKGYEKVIFDRGSRRYHGRIKSLAEGARTKGLIF